MNEDASIPPAPAAPEKRKGPLLAEQWQEIRTLAELGQTRVKDLAIRFGVTPSAVSQHLRDHKVVIGSKAATIAEKMAEKVAEKVAEIAIPFAERRLARIEETRDFYYRNHELIDKIIMGKIVAQVRDKKPIADVGADIKTLTFAKRSLFIGRKERFAVLDAEKHVSVDELPDLIVRDLADEEIKAIQTGEDPLDMDELPTIEEIVAEGEGHALP